MQSLLRRHPVWSAPSTSSRPRRAVARVTGRNEQPASLNGVQRGPVQPADFRESRSRQQAAQEGEDAAEEFLLLQSAISKTYRQKLLQFRRTVTPDMLDSIRAGLPPEHHPQLEMIMREAAALGPEDDAMLGAEADALTHEEQLAWEVLQDPDTPADFMSYLSDLVPGVTDEEQLQELLGQLPEGVVQELQDLFWELKEFEASDGMDADGVAERYVMLSERIDSLSEEVDRQQEEQQRQQWLLEQQSQQAQQQQGAQQHQGASQQRGPYGPELGSSSSNSSSSSSGGISRDVGRSGGSPAAPASGVGSGRTVVGPAPPAWQQARQQQRRSMATWAV